MNNLNVDLTKVRSVLLNLPTTEDNLELVAAYIHSLSITDDEKLSLWSEWLSFHEEAQHDDIFDSQEGDEPPTLEHLEELANDALHASIHDTKAVLANLQINSDNFNTDMAVAKQFLDLYNKEIRYITELSKWIEWNGSYWSEVHEEYLVSVLTNAINAIFRNYKYIGNYSETELKSFYNKYSKMISIRAVLELLKSLDEITVANILLDNDTTIVGCINGAIDLNTGELTVSSKEQYLTKKVNIRYNPDALCPTWDKVINDVFFDDEEMVSFFKRLIGCSLLGSPKEDILVIPYGSGANGKSTVFNTIARVFGDYASNTNFSTFTTNTRGSGHREDLVRLQGSRFIYTSEPEAHGTLQEGLIKSMTGGDTIVARTAYARKSVEITPTWTIFIPIVTLK